MSSRNGIARGQTSSFLKLTHKVRLGNRTYQKVFTFSYSLLYLELKCWCGGFLPRKEEYQLIMNCYSGDIIKYAKSTSNVYLAFVASPNGEMLCLLQHRHLHRTQDDLGPCSTFLKRFKKSDDGLLFCLGQVEKCFFRVLSLTTMRSNCAFKRSGASIMKVKRCATKEFRYQAEFPKVVQSAILYLSLPHQAGCPLTPHPYHAKENQSRREHPLCSMQE